MMNKTEKFPEEEGTEYRFSGLAKLNEQLISSGNGLSDNQRAYGLVLLDTLDKYVTEEKLMQMYSEEHNSMNICYLLAEETVTVDLAEKISMLDVRLQKFSEHRPETNTAFCYALLKEIADIEPGTQEAVRDYIRKWAVEYTHIKRTLKILNQAKYVMGQTERIQERQYRNLVCFGIERVIYSGNKTIVLFDDGTKTTATCDKDDTYSMETGLLICILKHIYGSKICKFLNDFADETEKAERNESELVYIQNSSKSAVKKTEKASMAEVK